MPITVNMKDVAGAPEPLAPGVYPAMVSSHEVRQADERPFPYISWEYSIDGTDRKVYDITSLSPKALFRLKAVLVAFGVREEELEDEAFEFEPEDFYGTQVLLTVNTETYNGVLRNRVTRVRPTSAPDKAFQAGTAKSKAKAQKAPNRRRRRVT